MAAGLIVTLSALQPLLQQQKPARPSNAVDANPRDLATSPIAFPGIVSPRAIAVLIIFVAYFPALDARLAIFAVAGGMLALDYLGMRSAAWFMSTIGMVPLLVLVAVFGVLQVALGVETLVNGWQALSTP